MDLFHQIAGGWKLSPDCREYFFADLGTKELLAIVKKNPLFCPADIKAAIDTAQLNAVHRTLNLTKDEDIHHIEIEVEDLRLSLLSMRLCLNRDNARMLAEIYQTCRRGHCRLGGSFESQAWSKCAAKEEGEQQYQ